MGAKTWMLVYSDRPADEILKSKPTLNREKSLQLANRLFPKHSFQIIDDADLSFTSPPDNEIYIGCFPGLSVIAATEFGIDYPSKLTKSFIDAAEEKYIYLHAMHSVVDWFAYAIWKEGKLERSLSLSTDSGIIEDIGSRLNFEQPYWSGKHPAIDPEEDDFDYPFCFHPLELAEAALLELFGYQLEGAIDIESIAPETIPLVALKRKNRWWKLW